MKDKPPIENLVAYFDRHLSYYEAKPAFVNLNNSGRTKKRLNFVDN